MSVWKLTAANNLVKSEEDVRPEPGKRRVRVTKVFLNMEDVAICKGQRKVKYPFVPGRFAVGLLADEGENSMFPKGARVLLHTYLPAEDGGVEKKDFTEDDLRICGQTADGFLRDFVYAREDEFTLLPDSVGDEKALLLHHIALAQATVEALDAKRGEHIAVIGGNILGLFTARLLIYRQAAPILIDGRQDRLDFARGRGVYYTSLNDDSLLKMVGTVTGGRLADGAVFVPSAGGNDPALPIEVCAAGKHVAYCGYSMQSIPLEVEDVIKKRLTVHGVSDGTEDLEMAINFLANKAIDLSAFRFIPYSADRVQDLLGELSSGDTVPVNEIRFVNLA